jgi:D-alanine-D-alanine ligase
VKLCILYNRDADLLENDPGREAREDVTRVAAALAEALTEDGHDLEILGVGGRDPVGFVDVLRHSRPELVVNLCESLAADSRGEMAVPCLLDLLGIPYTGSPPLALGLALHKDKAKAMLRSWGVQTAPSVVVERPEDVAAVELPFPLIVKPAREDASVGIDFDSVVHDRVTLGQAVARVLETFRQPALVERFIEGREIYVPLLGNRPHRALPLSEVHFGKAFDGRPNIVSYTAKWETQSPEFMDSTPGPCTLPAKLEARVVEVATAAFEALGCQDYGRVDLRLSPDGEPWVIDVNPNCDLHPEAGFARAAAAAGIGYPALARRLIELAHQRTHGNPTHLFTGSAGPVLAARQGRAVLAARAGLRPRAHRRRAPGQH